MAQEPTAQSNQVRSSSSQTGPRQGSRPPQRTSSTGAGSRPSSGQSRPYQRRDSDQDGGYQRRGSDQGGFRGRGRFHRRKVCLFCADKTKVIDWKKYDELRRFIGENGSIYPRRKSGLCARHQRPVAIAIKRARHIALYPFTTEHIRIMGKR